MKIGKPKSFEWAVRELQHVGNYRHPLKPSPMTCRLGCNPQIIKMGVIWKPRDLVRFEVREVARMFSMDSFVDTDNLAYAQ